LTDSTLELLTLHGLYDHTSALAESQRRQYMAARLHAPVESTAYLIFELIGSPDHGLPESLEDEDRQALLNGLVAQCPELAPAPQMLEAPVYAAYAMFDAQNAVRLHRLATKPWRSGGSWTRRFAAARSCICIRNAATGSTCRSGRTCSIRNCRKNMARCGHRPMSGCSRPICRSNGPGRC